MAGPLIPFIQLPEIPLGFLTYLPLVGDAFDPAHPPSIKPFGTLVALGVYAGSMLTIHRARQRKLDTKQLSDFIFWVVAWGFVISHVLDSLFYHPATVWRDPLYLLRVWEGLSSYGGFIGAVIGALAWRAYRKQPILELIDVGSSCMPLAWVFGRSGCAVVHDHPGAVSDAWFAVQFPLRYCQGQLAAGAQFCGRYDLGLIEAALTVPLAVAMAILWRREPCRPVGFYVGLTLIAYAPVRFFLDFLRLGPDAAIFRGATDLRYAGLTPAQWVCFVAFGGGAYFVWRTWGKPYQALGPAAPDEDDDPEAERVAEPSDGGGQEEPEPSGTSEQEPAEEPH